MVGNCRPKQIVFGLQAGEPERMLQVLPPTWRGGFLVEVTRQLARFWGVGGMRLSAKLDRGRTEMDAAYIFADHVANTNFEDLPSEVVKATKRSVLDTIGVILAGSGTTPGILGLIELIMDADGKKESTIFVFGGRVPAWMAAFANGAMAHTLDYDDLHYDAHCHPGTSTLPAALAIAERVGKIEGKRFIAAIALGQDLMARMGLSLRGKPKFFRTPVLGTFAATATVGKILGLNQEKLVNAFGIALGQAGETYELRWGVGSDLAGMYPAFPAQAGVLSALMAEKGITGPKNSFEGAAGLFNCHFNGQYDREVLLADLGKKFEGVNTSVKAWPACGATHTSIDATLSIVNEDDIRPEDVEEVTVFVSDSTRTLTEPLEGRQKPSTTLDAKYSLPWTVAAAIARRNVVLRDFTEEGRKDPVTLALAHKVTPKYDASLNFEGTCRGMVEIKTKDGKSYCRRSDYPYGHVSKPLTDDAVITKFMDCASLAARPVRKATLEKIIAIVGRLDELPDVSQIAELLG